MTSVEATIVLAALLAGPLLFAPLERNLEPYCLILGLIAVSLGNQWEWSLVRRAMLHPLPITITVIVAGLLFGELRTSFDKVFAGMRRLLPRPLLVGLSIVLVGLLSSVITAIVAALVLVEGVASMGAGPILQRRVVVLGCFAIGLGSALTPIGEPLATLATSAMKLSFDGLFKLLWQWVLPGLAAVSILAGYFARRPYDLIEEGGTVHESPLDAVMQGVKVFAFIAGLILIGDACAATAIRYVERLSNDSLFWANIVSAALDNATLVAIEFHGIEPARARLALLSLLVSGGILIPGNVPNIVCAGKLRMKSWEWARFGLPAGLILLGIYFAAAKWFG